MKKLFLFLAFLLAASCAQAQVTQGQPEGPVSTCSAGPVQYCNGVTYVLDELSSYPPEALSVRELTGGQYQRPYDMLVRRASDNTTQNIGFANGLINKTALTSFCASTNCYVVTWYNQGSLGSAGDATQSTAASQPQIVANGVVETQNGVPTLSFGSASSAFARMTLSGPTTLAYSAFSVIQKLSSSQEGTVLAGYTPLFTQFLRINASSNPLVNFGADNTSSSSVTNTSLFLYDNISSGMGVTPYQNGAALNAISLTSQTPGAVNLIGTYDSSKNEMFGNISEVILFTSAVSVSDKAVLDFNRAAFYGISGVTQ